MKRILSVLLLGIMFVTSVSFNVSAEESDISPMANDSVFAGGTGTKDDPYQVSTPEQLNEVRNYLDKYFIQINDIDMTEATSEGGTYWNDGAGWIPINEFVGHYDGRNYKIIGLNIYEYHHFVGLFGHAYGYATIENIVLTDGEYIIISENSSIEKENNCMIGGICGAIEGNSTNIRNCINKNKINISLDAYSTYNRLCYVGGICGRAYKISDCKNYGNISVSTPNYSTTCIGGIIGIYGNFDVSNCLNRGDINCISAGQRLNMGGIAGYKGDTPYTYYTNSDLYMCLNTGAINVFMKNGCEDNYEIGGIVGNLSMEGNINDCYNTGDIVPINLSNFLASHYVGGICGCVGADEKNNIQRCYNVGSTNGADGIGNVIVVSGYTNGIYYSYSLDTSPLNSNNTRAYFSKNLTEEEMKQKDNFETYDFDTVWDISPDINNGMPYLRNVGNFEPEYTLGDVNGDGQIDFLDAQLILKYDAGSEILTDDQINRSDVNGDGYVDFLDAQLILKFDAGLTDSLE